MVNITFTCSYVQLDVSKILQFIQIFSLQKLKQIKNIIWCTAIIKYVWQSINDIIFRFNNTPSLIQGKNLALPSKCFTEKQLVCDTAKLTREPWNPARLTNKSSCYLAIAAAAATHAVSPWELLALPLLRGLANTITDWLNPTTAARTLQASSSRHWWIVGGQPGWLAPDIEELLQCTPPKETAP